MPATGRCSCAGPTATIELLKPWGLPLGVLSTEHYHEGTATMAAGDLLVIYSDGLSEARPDLFKDPATVAARVSGDDSAAATAQSLVDLATGAGQLPDDLTVVVVRRAPETAKP